MFFHGGDQPQEDMQEGPAEAARNGGDGMHHHEIHEDEAGGFHSVHTHPDGNEEHGDHASYDEAADDMDAKFGQGDDQPEEGGDPDSDFGDSEDIAGAYGRKACE